MSFRKFQTKNNKYRKENDSFLAHNIIQFSRAQKERASAFTSRGSITLEAALAVSFFFFAILCLTFLLEIMVIQTTMKSALHAVAKDIAVEVCTNPVIPTSKMEREIVAQIGSERLERSLVAGGSSGIDCSQSKKYWNSTIMDLTVHYQIELPFLMFRLPLIAQKETIRVKGWTGHERKTASDTENTMVYVTDYGLVYHMDTECSYLELSIKRVTRQEAKKLRNQSGSKYKACAKCALFLSKKSPVYITDYGERYHGSLDCSSLKRGVYAVPLSDVHGLGGCSKCVE